MMISFRYHKVKKINPCAAFDMLTRMGRNDLGGYANVKL